jgi:hypothetical protein
MLFGLRAWCLASDAPYLNRAWVPKWKKTIAAIVSAPYDARKTEPLPWEIRRLNTFSKK